MFFISIRLYILKVSDFKFFPPKLMPRTKNTPFCICLKTLYNHRRVGRSRRMFVLMQDARTHRPEILHNVLPISKHPEDSAGHWR